MAARKSIRLHLKLTPEQQATIDDVRRTLDQDERAEIVALAKRLRSAKRRGSATLEETLKILKQEREAQGVSLATMEKRTGMAKSNLSKLERAVDSNPTVATLVNYAEALGKKLVITLVDK